ncbi:peptidase MA family metallohydrolase [Senegalia massiliensis]|uniref:peptidase MA family metallohydrolase n=1 Tax=Senegalia massiliensis TaxID=1720316 RepID=UPI0013EF013A|nr:collagenase [Senegalia massiliensis]
MKFLQGKLGSVLLIFILTSICINIVILTMFNKGLLDMFGEELTANEKLDFYKESFGRAIKINDYTKKINGYSESMNREEFRYITFYFSDKIDKKYIDATKESLSEAEDLTENILGKLEKESLKVILYDNVKEFKENADTSYNINGLYDGIGTIHLNMNKYKNVLTIDAFQDIFIHEYAHYIWGLYIKENDIYENIPVWFEEGVAEYIENNGVSVEYSISFEQNMEKFKKMNTREDFESLIENEDYNPYDQSYYAIDSLIEMKGKSIISEILNESKEKDFYGAFFIATGMEIEEFQNVFMPVYIDNYE